MIRLHGTCVARRGAGVLLLGPPGCGKSDLALRLLGREFELVADDQVLLEGLQARAPQPLAGLLEVRGLGIIRRSYALSATLHLAVLLAQGERIPLPERHEETGLSLVRIPPDAPSAVDRVALALECALGNVTQVAGAFAQ